MKLCFYGNNIYSETIINNFIMNTRCETLKILTFHNANLHQHWSFQLAAFPKLCTLFRVLSLYVLVYCLIFRQIHKLCFTSKSANELVLKHIGNISQYQYKTKLSKVKTQVIFNPICRNVRFRTQFHKWFEDKLYTFCIDAPGFDVKR